MNYIYLMYVGMFMIDSVKKVFILGIEYFENFILWGFIEF